jgi:hypothetical protein
MPLYKMPYWLAEWAPHDAVPANLVEIGCEMMRVERSVEPAAPELIAVCLRQVLDYHHPPRGNPAVEAKMAAWWARNAQIYCAALADLPPDLLALAQAHGVKARFFPKIADLRGPVEELLDDRKTALRRLAVMRDMARRVNAAAPRRTPPSTEDIAYVEARMRALRQHFDAIAQPFKGRR